MLKNHRVLGPLLFALDGRREVAANDVLNEWEKYERSQAAMGRVVGAVDTKIIDRPFDVNFQSLPSGDDGMIHFNSYPSIEAQARVLQLLLQSDTRDMTRSILDRLLDIIANETSSSRTTCSDESS